MSSTSNRALRVRLSGGLPLGKVGGVPVVLAHSWWFFAAAVLVLYTPLVNLLVPGTSLITAVVLAATFTVLLAVSVLLHEIGHCVVAVRMGLPVRRIRLAFLGGAAELVRAPTRPGQEGWIALAGPVVSVVLGAIAGVVALLLPTRDVLWLLVVQVAVANAVVGVVNLLPGLPLDGGRALRAAIWAMTGRRMTGTRAGVIGAGVVAAALIWWAVVGVIDNNPDRWLRLVICAVMAVFVIMGASAEWAGERRHSWPPGLLLDKVTRPVLQLPAETPVSAALAASAGRGVMLVKADGLAAGLLDQRLAVRLAEKTPNAPAEHAAEPINADTVLLASESGDEIVARVRGSAAWQYLIVDNDGRPCAVLHREDLYEALRQRG